ncbi:hypothetical protein OH76DRAFT_1480753 [Lentinus brumalis]|uniref:Uncharacterized protein n=1 Tax=Lentinus brumalis TaxID=2498619 RepID=A0A371DHW5_9APHY|nr:hypothetical protein OH76DRAFT_1480753 [Polyporus brumalis]
MLQGVEASSGDLQVPDIIRNINASLALLLEQSRLAYRPGTSVDDSSRWEWHLEHRLARTEDVLVARLNVLEEELAGLKNMLTQPGLNGGYATRDVQYARRSPSSTPPCPSRVRPGASTGSQTATHVTISSSPPPRARKRPRLSTSPPTTFINSPPSVFSGDPLPDVTHQCHSPEALPHSHVEVSGGALADDSVISAAPAQVLRKELDSSTVSSWYNSFRLWRPSPGRDRHVESSIRSCGERDT